MTATAYDLRVGDLMTLEPVSVAVDALVEDAQRLLLEYGVSGLPVVDEDGELVGVISQTDFMHLQDPDLASLVRHKSTGVRVGEVMSRPAVTVVVTTKLPDAARMMLDQRVHRLVVVDEKNRPVGVLSAIDFVQVIAEE